MLDDHDYQFLENISKAAENHYFNGIIKPSIHDAVQNFQPDAILIYGWSSRSHLKALSFFKGKIPFISGEIFRPVIYSVTFAKASRNMGFSRK